MAPAYLFAGGISFAPEFNYKRGVQMKLLEWLFNSEIHFGSKAIHWREVIGGLLGLSSAVLGLKRKVIAWPVGIIGDGLLLSLIHISEPTRPY